MRDKINLSHAKTPLYKGDFEDYVRVEVFFAISEKNKGRRCICPSVTSKFLKKIEAKVFVFAKNMLSLHHITNKL